MRLNDTTREYFERLAGLSAPDAAARYKQLVDPKRQRHIERYFVEHEPFHNSMLRTSVVPTMLQGGFRINVIPSQAEAGLDIRALPNEKIDEFYADLLGVVNDPDIELVPYPRTRPPAEPSRMDNEMFHTPLKKSRSNFPRSDHVTPDADRGDGYGANPAPRGFKPTGSAHPQPR